MKILCFGSCNIDYVYSVNNVVINGETTSAENLETFPGGKGLNQSIACAKAGAKVYHAGKVGTGGKILIETLTNSGVDIRYLGRTESSSGHAIIQLDKKGNNAIIIYSGANALINKQYVNDVLDNFGFGDIIILQNEINNIDYIVEAAYKKGMIIVFNPAPFNDVVKKVDLCKITYLILNEIEAATFAKKQTPEQNLEEICKKYPQIKTVLTVGEDGALYSEGKGIYYQSAYKVDVVDTTAAGDTFIGYFVSEIAKGRNPILAMKKASVAAALSVSVKGAASSIPENKEVEKAMLKLEKLSSNNGRTIQIKSKIQSFVEDNLQDVTLEKLAKELGYSKNYTSKLVFLTIGESFSDFIKNKRIDKAAKLLIETDLPISEIILKVGYENQSFFRAVFVKRYGTTPKKYRKNKEINN